MKKLCLGAVLVFALFLSVNPANAYTAYFTVDHPNLNALTGFEFDVTRADIGNLTLTIFYQLDSFLPRWSGAVPEPEGISTYPWEIVKTADGVFGFDNSSVTLPSPLTSGVVLSLSDTDAFDLVNFAFAGNNPDGSFSFPYSVNVSDLANRAVYNFTAAPIPSSIILLGGGLMGLVAVKRRRRSY